MRTIRWGIIGCGNVTEVKSGPGFQKATHSALVAVMRRNGALAADYAQRHGVARWYDNAQALIQDPTVDAVYIATPPNAHLEYTLAVAQAGKPVYVEKPMARTHAECQQMIAACQAAGVPLWVAYYRRRLPRFVKVKELLEAGAIGAPRTVTVRFYRDWIQPTDGQLPWRVDPAIAGGGFFVDLASHTFDYLDYFLGPIVQAQGEAGNQGGYYPAEDSVAGSFVFASGVHGTGSWCFDSYQRVDETEIIGTKGKLTFSSFGTEPIRLATAQGLTEFPEPTPVHVQQPLIQTIVDELNGHGQCPSTGTSAARTNWVMDQLLQKYYAEQCTNVDRGS
ncbi:MAG: Gfo/Idh/MocA family oxidoreductase [Caldilineaceae bacterium]|nr:Gfo/Idh/MocA family oxidoreductase [Caldilineaceae bacterium]